MADGPPAAKRPRRGFKECSLCHFQDKHMKKHVFAHHLPVYLDPQMICWICKKYVGSFDCLQHFHLKDHPEGNKFTEDKLQQYYSQVNYLLHELSKKITGKEDPRELLLFVTKNKLYPSPDQQRVPFTTFESALISGLQIAFGDSNKPLEISPPNQIASLLHWRIQLNLFSHLDEETQKELKSFDVQKQFVHPMEKFQSFADSHFHLDKLTQWFKVKNLSQVANRVHKSLDQVDFAIANYVYPDLWNQIDDQVTDPKIYYTIGVHPHRIFEQYQYPVKPIIDHLKNEKCVGIGEIGLNFTTNCQCKKHSTQDQKANCKQNKIEAQKTFLDNILYALKNIDTVIVIHSRGEGAAEAIRQWLLHYGLQNKRIHRHCFTGDMEEATIWMNTFPNMKFSISSILLDSENLQQAVTIIPSSQLLLESDSPYLSPDRNTNHPWNIKHHGELLSSLKNIPLSLLQCMTLMNTQILYQVKPANVPDPNKTEHKLFNGPNTPLSNFFPCKIDYQEHEYNSTEQVYQWIKAVDIGNTYIADEILAHNDPFAIKKLSNNLPAEAVKRWHERCGIYLMMELLNLKYEQVPEFQDECNSLQNTLLFESTTDTFWGIGYRKQEAKHVKFDHYMGQNTLGWIIMLICDTKLGKDTTWIKAAYYKYPQICAFHGIKHILPFIK